MRAHQSRWVLAVLSYLFCCQLAWAQEVQPPTNKPTEVIIIGTIHKWHLENPRYSPEVLKRILSALEPNAILNELPLSQVDKQGRPIYKSRNTSAEGWAADTVASQLGIRQIPFDRPDREENFKKTRYFEREQQVSQLKRGAARTRSAVRSARDVLLAQTYRRRHGRQIRVRRDVPAAER